MELITRKEAKERGLDKYYAEKPCKRGHVEERYASSGHCVACMREKYEENKEYMKERNKKWKEENKEHTKEYGKKWREENKEYDKKYYQENKEHRNEYQNEYRRDRYATDENFRMAERCRYMIYRTLKATTLTKTSRTYVLLGYCNEELVQNIESKFADGMSWENQSEWHIDHKYPVSRYFKDGVADPAIINALDNLIPMWAEHNLEKGDMTLAEYLEVRNDLNDVYGRFL